MLVIPRFVRGVWWGAWLTISTGIKIDDAPYAHVDDAEKTLVLLLELLLVKYLYGEHAILGHPPGPVSVVVQMQECIAPSTGVTYMSKLSFQYGFSVFLMTLVVRVCSPLMVATAKGSGKPRRMTCELFVACR